ncbi:hypothetical protein AB0A63_01050 [Lentzea sp. NPDC042327]|uniref:hypothetical protein n=1 Tax=Lentzea sp. NPDC042327 TaxID=3154801 RepID=UPI0033E1D067
MTTADEIETMKAAARRHVLAVQSSPLVNGKAGPFLEDLADRCLDDDFHDALKHTAAQHRLDGAADIAALHRLLTDNGVVAERNGVVRFVPDRMGDFLAACRAVHEDEGRLRFWLRQKAFLRPGGAWRKNSGVAQYQVALWWDTAEAMLRKRLDALLSPKHADTHVHFVAELLHRRLVPADDLREKTVGVLHEQLADLRREAGAWRASVATLRELEPEQTADALERLARLRNRDTPSLRRFNAVEVLTEMDPVRGEQCLRLLAGTLTGGRTERLDVAGLIWRQEAALGLHAYRCLAADPDMGDRRLDAARLSGDTALWAGLIGREGTLSDAARLAHLGQLAEADEAEAVRTAERFADSASTETTPVAIARAVRPWDARVALRIAEGVAWPPRRKIAGPVRLEAVHLIGDLVPSRRFSDLARLSREAEDEETQLAAALSIVDQGGPATALHAFAANPKKSRERRLVGARRICEAEPKPGGLLLIDIAKTHRAVDRAGVELLLEALKFAAGPAAEALEKVARDTGRPAELRILAVESGAFDKAKSITLCELIATTTTSDRDLMLKAARKVVGMKKDAGEQLMARLAELFPSDISFQVSLLREAGGRGKGKLRQIGLFAQSADHRLDAAKALVGIDRKFAAEVIDKIVKKRRAGEVRIEAACLLPGEQRLKWLLHVVGDLDTDAVRFEAGRKAVEVDEERGKEALRRFAEDHRVSRRTREEIKAFLGR